MNISDIKIKSTGKYLRIESGEPHDLRILSEDIIERMVHGFGKDSTICGGASCFKCAGAIEIKQRFFVNTYDHTVQRVMIWEFGPGIAKKLIGIANTLKEEGRTLQQVDIKVEARGTGLNKKYEVTPRMSAKEIPTGLVFHKIEAENEVPF